jgi:transcriptional regulator with XRE-family HTH domain
MRLDSGMDSDNALGEYLRARRQAVIPEDLGAAVSRRTRRVPGLRREEVAQLAGISVEYYVRMEQGRERHPSVQVMAALAAALELDAASEEFLRRLVEPPTTRPTATVSGASLKRLIDGLPSPAFAHDRVLEVLESNALARALLPDFAPGTNLMRYAFLDPAAREFYLNWDEMTGRLVAYLRAQAAVPSVDPRLPELVAELSAQSDHFESLWGRHDVRPASTGVNRLHHPVVGRIDLSFDRLCYAGTSDPVILIYQAEPGSASALALARLPVNP